MPINPHKGETQSEWMSRCVPEMIGTGDDKRPREQAVAACLTIWRDKDKAMAVKQPEPDPDESYEEFMDRCVGETGDEEMCDMQWENRETTHVITKTHSGQVDGAEYILSDESSDRMGDIIQAAGWKLDNFKRNPIALAFHRSDFVIGTWKNLRVDGNQLRGHLELAPAGTSDRIDEIRRLVDAGILRATSVGFRPIKHEAIDEDERGMPPMFRNSGTRFLEQELVETSLVSVPANPNALAVAKGLDISGATLALVFGKHAKEDERKMARGSTGKHADPPPVRTKAMSSISANITEAQGQLVVLQEGLEQHLETLDNDNVTDDQMKRTDDFHAKIAKKKRLLEQHIESEKALGNKTAAANEAHEIRMPTRHVPAPSDGVPRIPAQVSSIKSGDLLWKALVVLTKLRSDRYSSKSNGYLDVLRDTVGENEKVRAVYDGIVGKAATVPALTTAVGWAAELVTTERQAFMESLQPKAVLGPLMARGMSFNFGSNGIISIPTRNATPTIAGSFVGEGAAIPVRQGAFSAITMTPKKLAVITVFSREISEHSDPAIEGLLRQAISEDTAVAADSVLLDANAATAVRPAGLRSGVSTLTPTAGGGFAAVIGDIKGLYGALVTATLGNVRNAVLLMPPNLALALSLTVAPNGTFAFPTVTLEGGTLAGIPIIVSPNVTADTVYVIDAADFVSASGAATFSLSDSATLHMEDTAPTAIGSTGTPNVVAAPVRSLWQTDTLAIRMIMQLNWSMRRAGMIAYVTGVTWK